MTKGKLPENVIFHDGLLNEDGNLALFSLDGMFPEPDMSMRFVALHKFDATGQKTAEWEEYSVDVEYEYEDGSRSEFHYIVKANPNGIVSVIAGK